RYVAVTVTFRSFFQKLNRSSLDLQHRFTPGTSDVSLRRVEPVPQRIFIKAGERSSGPRAVVDLVQARFDSSIIADYTRSFYRPFKRAAVNRSDIVTAQTCRETRRLLFSFGGEVSSRSPPGQDIAERFGRSVAYQKHNHRLKVYPRKVNVE